MAQLVLLEGEERGQAFALERDIPTSVGREKSNRIRVSDFSVSRRHAEIVWDRGVYTVIDLESTNRTYVNNQPITRQVLNHGDRVRFGNIHFVFEHSDGAWSAESAGRSDVSHELRPLLAGELRSERTVELDGSAILAEIARLQQESRAELSQADQKLLALYQINTAITTIDDLPALLGSILNILFTIIPADRGVIMLHNDKTGMLELTAVKTSSAQFEKLSLSSTVVQKVMSERKAVLISDTRADAELQLQQSIISAEIKSAMCAPLLFKDQVLGILYLDSVSLLREYRLQDLELLAAIAAQVGIVLQNARLYSDLKEYFLETIGSLSAAIEARDPYTQGHTWRVTQYAKALAAELGWEPAKLREVEMAGLLHDIGKIGVSDAILLKPAPLEPSEFEVMKGHPDIGAEIVSHLSFLSFCLPYVRYHQEKYDGSGYPEGLAGEAIPIEGRLLAVADTFDAMTTQRPYRNGLAPEIAIQELQRCAGKQFDPGMVAAFVRCWDKGVLQEILYTERGSTVASLCPRCNSIKYLRHGLKGGEAFLCSVCRAPLVAEVEGESCRLALRNGPDPAAAPGDSSRAPAP
jgi:HD-GYP domain-containing protein (c-di-GMP phosphodiesterase class II)